MHDGGTSGKPEVSSHENLQGSRRPDSTRGAANDSQLLDIYEGAGDRFAAICRKNLLNAVQGGNATEEEMV